MQLAAVIVTYNRLEALKTSLPRMLAEEVDRVLVVDNASSDGTGDWLATQDDARLEVLRLTENGGGAGGFAAGIDHLQAGPVRYDWICVLDDDAWPQPRAMATFRTAVAEGRYGTADAVGAAVLTPQGAVSEMNRPARNPFWAKRLLVKMLLGAGRGSFHFGDADYAADGPVRPIDSGSFVGLFIAQSALARRGGPNPDLFIYGDDVLFCLTLRRAGGVILFDPSVRFAHDCATLGAGLETRPLWKVYYLCRNGVLVARTAAGWLMFPAALGWYMVAWARKAAHYAPHERKTYRRLMWMGVRDGLMRRLGRRQKAHDIAALVERPRAG